MFKNRLVKFLSGYSIIMAGVLIVSISDIIRFTRAFSPPVDPTIEVIRFTGLLLFFLGVVIKLIQLENTYRVAHEQHERMFDEITRIQIHTGLRLPDEELEFDPNKDLHDL